MKKIIVALAMAPVMAHASFYDGASLLLELNGTQGQQLGATTYLMGLADAVGGTYACFPPTMTGYQLSLTVRKNLSANPELLDRNAPALVIPLMVKTWPCKKGSAL